MKARLRTHQPWMPGQGSRARYADIVFATREEAETYKANTDPKLPPGWWQQIIDEQEGTQ